MKRAIQVRSFFQNYWPAALTFLFVIVAPVLCFATEWNPDEPTLGDIKFVLIRVVNWAVFVVGIVFVLVLAYGAWKASTALGDPRGLESAKGTWTYALFGVIIVVGFFAIFSIVGGFFGFKFGISAIFDDIFKSLNDLFLVVPGTKLE